MKNTRWLFLEYLLISCYISFITDAESSNYVLGAPQVSPIGTPFTGPTTSELPLPANLPLFHRPYRKPLPPLAAPAVPVPSPSSDYGSLTTSSNPPSSSRASKPSMKRNQLPAPSADLLPPLLTGVAPEHSNSGKIPSGLAQPPLSPQISDCCGPDMVLKRGSQSCHCVYPIKLDLLLLNVSLNSNLSPFLGELASQLGLRVSQFEIINFYVLSLSRLNISIDITPHTGISFSASDSLAINKLLAEHRIHLDPSLVGDYKLLNFTWFKPPAPSQAKPRTTDAISKGGSLPHPSSTRFLAYEELKEATNDFEPASVLGEGGFGRVFKGVLSDGTAVAIKKLTNGGQQGDKEFLVEVEMLSRLHHRNLVKLVGYCSSRDSLQNLLCYELVPNGSLEAWLHGPLGVNCPLDWDTRMKIALDSARGLAYLHEDSQPCVIHRDFKASNILLENNFHAKVADFGLAKQAPEGRANYLSTRVMGTFGYVAPEYAMTGHLLVKSDVYSYGVVLLELLTGRKPVDMSQPSGQENLVTWARPILRDKDRLEELADPRLGGKYPEDDFVRVCTIAAACVAPEANQRPTMGEVVQSLKMVQRITEYQDSMLATSNSRTNLRQSSTTYESDGTSSMFSSGPFSGLSAFDNDNISRTAVFSEDLHEGR
uniref:Protein kinase domain-containing protein n=1 Tax=Nelumbo nucifera TaxID=4432 RepID=A0A822YG13_NELNU|nr:TPA_asm: hypothetical protein HUJ06_011965 [Nelumbo nucifera]